MEVLTPSNVIAVVSLGVAVWTFWTSRPDRVAAREANLSQALTNYRQQVEELIATNRSLELDNIRLHALVADLRAKVAELAVELARWKGSDDAGH